MAKKQTKYIFVTGGVLSGLGKGITAASLGTILKARGFDVGIMKCDPYLNTDAGTLNPAEHGEVFVTRDGAETDLDLGHYERFIDRELTQSSSLMSGRIYAQVIADERAGKYLGKTVQIIPHVTGEIQKQIEAAGRGRDIHIVEIGGTVGDYESLAFLDALRQFKRRVGSDNVAYVHVVYLPYLAASQELKTKPAQNSVRDLREAGINPDVIMARSDHPISQHIIDKISLFGDIDTKGIVPLETASSVYKVPLALEESGIADYIAKGLGLSRRRAKLTDWRKLVERIDRPGWPPVKIGIVAKYLTHVDTYMSVFEALKAAAWQNGAEAELIWVDAEKLEGPDDPALQLLDGLVVPGGFGTRGFEGKIAAAQHSIKHGKPYLGLCLGMQAAVVAVGRQALKTTEVNSTEMDPKTQHPIIDLMADQTKVTDKGGTMRLGDYPCVLDPKSRAAKLYGQKKITERHRHRYEVNNRYREKLQSAGLRLAGLSPDGRLVELVELDNHPFFMASQYHPEFLSRPNRPHPLFGGFMEAVLGQVSQAVPAKRKIIRSAA